MKLSTEVAEDLVTGGRTLLRDGTSAVVLFGDLILTIVPVERAALVRVVKVTAEVLLGRDPPGLALRIDDRWLDDEEVRRLTAGRPDPEGTVLVERLSDLVAFVTDDPLAWISARGGMVLGGTGPSTSVSANRRRRGACWSGSGTMRLEPLELAMISNRVEGACSTSTRHGRAIV